MRVALVSPLYEAVPPLAYGGTERVIAALAGELVARGHDVTLFAAGGSDTPARLVAGSESPLRLTMARSELEEIAPHLHLRMLSEVYGRADEFDLIHAHTDIWTLPFARGCSVPTLLTLHGRLDLDVVRAVLPMYPDVPLASVSNHQRLAVADLPLRWIATCPNGLDLSGYFAAPKDVKGEYLAFVGRLTPEKRPDWAVEVARRSGRPLRVAAKVDPLDVEYWERVVDPLFRSYDVEFVGEIGEAEKPAFYAGAAATLFPIDWPEPFGLVMIESLASGTPVIAMRNGSVPEILTDGSSGFVCDSLNQMVAAVDRLGELRPAACRREAARFTASAMTDDYLAAYATLIADPRLGSDDGSQFALPGVATVP